MAQKPTGSVLRFYPNTRHRAVSIEYPGQTVKTLSREWASFFIRLRKVRADQVTAPQQVKDLLSDSLSPNFESKGKRSLEIVNEI